MNPLHLRFWTDFSRLFRVNLPFCFSGILYISDLERRSFELSASARPLPHTGSKSCIISTILSVMPEYDVYIEPCLGNVEVFFRKTGAEKKRSVPLRELDVGI